MPGPKDTRALAFVCAVLCAAPGAARAQDYKDWDIDEARTECGADAYAPSCATLRRRCIEAYDHLDVTRRAVCAELGIDPAGYARRLIEQARAYCTDGDGLHPDCAPLREACERGPPSCAKVVELTCGGGADAYCDRQTLCSEASIARLCDLPAAPGVAVSLAQLTGRYRRVGGELDGHVAALGAAVRGSNRSPLGMAYGAGGEVGWYSEGAAAYEANLMLGVAANAGHGFAIGVLGGGGVSGISDGQLPFGWVAAGELFAAVNVGGVQLLAYARPSRIYGSEVRRDGSPALSFADELDAGLALTRATGRVRSGSLRAFGWALELVYRESLGERWLGLGLGLGRTKWPAGE